MNKIDKKGEKDEEMEKFGAELRGRRILVVSDGINPTMAGRIIDGLLSFNFESTVAEIKLIIDSSGGNVVPALRVFDTIRLSKAPVVGIVHGRCDSVAVSLFQACHRRLTTANSTFFLHFITSDLKFKFHESEKEVLKRLRAVRVHNHQLQERIEKILSARTGRTIAQLRQLMQKGELEERRIMADEALKLGLVDEVIDTYDIFSPLPEVY